MTYQRFIDHCRALYQLSQGKMALALLDVHALIDFGFKQGLINGDEAMALINFQRRHINPTISKDTLRRITE